MPQETARQLEGSVTSDDAVAVARLITEHAVEGIFLLDSEGRTTFANPAAEQMFGWSLNELRGLKLHDVIHHHRPNGEPFPMSQCPLGNVFTTGRSLRLHEDTFFRRDGEQVPVACSNAAIIRDNIVVGGVLIVRDISERVEAEKHRQLLLGELNHRVKNMLAVVQGIAEQSMKGENLAPVRQAFTARIRALAEAQDLLTEGRGVDVSLARVIERAIAPFSRDDRVHFEGPEVVLPAGIATSFSMAIHELATNAMKYGALSNQQGRISINWAVADGSTPERLDLVWRETGGPTVIEPSRRGFGSQMIERVLAAEIDGKVKMHFEPEGLVCTISSILPEPALG